MQTITEGSATYAAECRAVSRQLAPPYDAALFVRLNARATVYKLVLVPIDATAQFGDPDVQGESWLVVSVIGHGSYWFDLNSYLHPSFIADKLNVTGGDGEVLAEFLSRLGASRRIAAV